MPPLRGVLLEDPADRRGRDRVDRLERLVQHEQARGVQQRGGQPDLLAHAGRVVDDELVAGRGQVEHVEQLAAALGDHGRAACRGAARCTRAAPARRAGRTGAGRPGRMPTRRLASTGPPPACELPHTSYPSTYDVPASGRSSPVAIDSVVVLPAPFGPTRARRTTRAGRRGRAGRRPRTPPNTLVSPRSANAGGSGGVIVGSLVGWSWRQRSPSHPRSRPHPAQWHDGAASPIRGLPSDDGGSDGRGDEGAGAGERAGADVRTWNGRSHPAGASSQGARRRADRAHDDDRRRGAARQRRAVRGRPAACARLGARHLQARDPAGRRGSDRGRPRRGSRLARDVVRRPRGDLPQGRRPAVRAVPRHDQRLDHARPVQDRAPGRDRRRLRARRLLALQRALRAADPRGAAAGLAHRHVEPHGPPPARGIRLRDRAVQLHVDRGEPADRARAHGQRRDLEAVAHPAVLRALPHAAARGGRAAGRCGEHAHRPWPADLRGGARAPRPGRDPLHRLDADVPPAVEAGRRQHLELPVLSTPGRRDRWQGLHRRAPVGRPRRAADGDGPRRVRVPGPEVLGGLARVRSAVDLEGPAGRLRRRGRLALASATSPTSATSWAR